MTEPLEELETRVTARYIEKCNIGWQLPDVEPLDTSDWYMGPLPDDVPQFPREQWITYPNRRHYALLIADRMLDFWDDLDEPQRTQLAFLLGCGGRERIA